MANKFDFAFERAQTPRLASFANRSPVETGTAPHRNLFQSISMDERQVYPVFYEQTSQKSNLSIKNRNKQAQLFCLWLFSPPFFHSPFRISPYSLLHQVLPLIIKLFTLG